MPLLFEAVKPKRGATEFFRQQLDDYLSAQSQILGKEDLAHSAKPKQAIIV